LRVQNDHPVLSATNAEHGQRDPRTAPEKQSAKVRVLNLLRSRTGECLSYEQIAAAASVSKRTVGTIISAALKSGQLSRIRFAAPAQGTTGHAYFFHDASKDDPHGTSTHFYDAWPEGPHNDGVTSTTDEQWAPQTSTTPPYSCMPAVSTSSTSGDAIGIEEQAVLRQTEVHDLSAADLAIIHLEAEAGIPMNEPGRSRLRIAFREDPEGVWACWQEAGKRGTNPVALLLHMIASGEHRTRKLSREKCGRCGRSDRPLEDVTSRVFKLGGISGWSATSRYEQRWLSCEECSPLLEGMN